MKQQSTDYQMSLKRTGDGELALDLSGKIDVNNAGKFVRDLGRLIVPQRPQKVRLDLGSVSYLDSSGAAALLKMESELKAKGISLVLENLPSSVKGILELLDLDALFKAARESRVRKAGIIYRIGEKATAIFKDAAYQTTFIGELILVFRRAVFHPRQIRWGDMAFTIERVGVDALPIVCLVTYLVGLTVGFQSAITLRQFGANIYLADMVALGMVRELGPLMTAILVAGRSGSAFTAEIGTMKVSEEVDALTSMGFDPIRFLVVPKVLATVLVVPTLTLFGNLLGILGGLTVGVSLLDLTIQGYVTETYNALSLEHVFSGLLKSLLFGLTIAVIGCLRGFQVEGGAESVGRQATSSVVSSIFIIIALDAVFGVLYQVWNI